LQKKIIHKLNNKIVKIMKKLCVFFVMCVFFVINAQAQRTVIQDQPAAITVQPVASAAVCESNGIITIPLTATGTGLTYQWQEFITSWLDISNGAVFAGVTTNTLTLTNAPASYNGRQYRCIVTSTGTCGNNTTSTSAAITLNLNAAITVQPLASTACAGSPASFSVTATGFTLSYQWQENGVNLANGGVYSNVTTSTLNISDVTGLSGKQYSCVVTGACGSPVTSNAATLTVNTLPAITTQPTAPAATCAGTGTQTITVAASGTGLTYQWYENGFACTNDAIHSGSTAATLTLTNAPATYNGYQYYCIVTGTCAPAVTSNTITITVNPQATVTVAPTAQQVCAWATNSLYLNTVNFSVTTAGPDTYQWQANPGSGWANATGGVYTNDNTNTLTVTNPLFAMNGTQMRVQMTTGAGCVSYTTPVTMTVNPLPTQPTWLIANSPADTVNYCAGGVTMTLNPTQGSNVNYTLQDWPGLTPVGGPQTGNNALRTWLGIPAGQYVFEILNATTGCGIRQLQ